ncbi:alkaline phosphatase family protein [Kangiella sp. HD9-110m-PIT-SAG07]|nr:alkaline phosphatase family protein [Kangiella sp. HD9-110m-PIT-SAG07]
MRSLLSIVVSSLFLFSCNTSPNKTVEDDAPRLVVFISIDQWHRDLLKRYQEHYTGGFKTIWEDSRFYGNAYHDHSATLTGPGHSVLLTGAYPAKTGITGNYFYDRQAGEEKYCVADSHNQVVGSAGALDKAGVSPKHLLVPTVGDLLKQANPQSKVFSVSGKDRSGILMGGKEADGVYWYDKSKGELVTSSFYEEQLAEFIQSYNTTNPVDNYNPKAWRRLKPESFYLEHTRQDLFAGEYLIDNKNFPYQLAPKSSDDTSFYSMVSRTPFADQYILDAAQYIIKTQDLGQDANPDLLAIGLSATDYVGHTWGPYSQEALDHMLRLDQFLGQFFRVLKQRFGDDVVIALSADHGVQPLPEYQAQQGKDARRVPKMQLIDDIRAIESWLRQEFELQKPLVEMKEERYPFFYPQATLAQKRRFVEEAEKLEYINRVVISDELAMNDKISQYVAKTHYQPRSRDIYFVFKENYLVSRSLGTTHGSIYAYDQQVPIVLMGADFKPEQVSKTVSTTDIAPTLAKLLGIEYQGFDGDLLP